MHNQSIPENIFNVDIMDIYTHKTKVYDWINHKHALIQHQFNYQQFYILHQKKKKLHSTEEGMQHAL